MVSLLQRVTLQKRQSNQSALPRLSAPRLGSACPLSGIVPRAAATARPWPVAAKPASCRFTRSSIPTFGLGLNGAVGSRSKAKAELLSCRRELAREKPENAALNQEANVIVNDLREQARSYKPLKPAGRPLCFAFDLDLRHTEPKRGAEWWGKS